MAMITPNFDEIVEFNNDPMPAGKYSARITKVEDKLSKAGNQMLVVEFTIFGAEGDLKRFNNWKMNAYALTSGKAAGRLKEIVRAAGLDLKGFDSDELLSKEVTLTIGHRPDDQGTMRPDIKAVSELDAIPF